MIYKRESLGHSHGWFYLECYYLTERLNRTVAAVRAYTSKIKLPKFYMYVIIYPCHALNIGSANPC